MICFGDLSYYLRNYVISQNRKGFSSYNPFSRTTYMCNYLCKLLTARKGKQVDPEKVSEVNLSVECHLHGLRRK